jgi:hypothetical protein
VVASGDSRCQRLTAAMDKCGRWHFTVAMGGSGGGLRRPSIAAVAVVFDGGSSVQWCSMAFDGVENKSAAQGDEATQQPASTMRG